MTAMVAATATIRGGNNDNGSNDDGSNDGSNERSGAVVATMVVTAMMAKYGDLIFIFRNNGELVLISRP